ncbi:hypothetical protein CR513_08794, partial [Mucuna pruriens]
MRVLRRYLTNPSMQHWKTTLESNKTCHITNDYILTYRKSMSLKIINYLLEVCQIGSCSFFDHGSKLCTLYRASNHMILNVHYHNNSTMLYSNNNKNST